MTLEPITIEDLDLPLKFMKEDALRRGILNYLDDFTLSDWQRDERAQQQAEALRAEQKQKRRY